MRVLHLLKTSVGATWALRQMRELVKLGADIHVALPSGGRHYEEYNSYGIKTYNLNIALSVKDFSSRVESLRDLVDSINPDIIHSHFVGTTLTMRYALRKQNIPRIFQVPGPLHLEHRLFRSGELLSSDRNDFWIGSCERTVKYYRDSGISNNKLFLSYYGTDTVNFQRRDSIRLRNSLGISSDTKIIGTVAYMYAPKKYLGQTRGLKGHEDLIDAVRLGIEKGHNLALVVVGGAWQGAEKYEQQVKQYAIQQLGKNVHFLGFRRDVADLYSEFDIAVHASHSENVGGAVESLLLEVPTVATRIGGFPDLIEEGVTGWLAESKNPLSLWDAIARALNDQNSAANITDAGHKKAKYLFDVQRTSQEIFNIYEIILERQRVRDYHG